MEIEADAEAVEGPLHLNAMMIRTADKRKLLAEEELLYQQLSELSSPENDVPGQVALLKTQLAVEASAESDEPIDARNRAVIADVVEALSWLAIDVAITFVQSRYGRACKPKIWVCDALAQASLSLHRGLSLLSTKSLDQINSPEQYLRNFILRDLKKMGRSESLNNYVPSSTQASRPEGEKYQHLYKQGYIDIHADEDWLGFEVYGGENDEYNNSWADVESATPPEFRQDGKPARRAHRHHRESNPRLIAQANELRQLLPKKPKEEQEKLYIDRKVDEGKTRSEIALELGTSVSSVGRIRGRLKQSAEALGYTIDGNTSTRNVFGEDSKEGTQSEVRGALPDSDITLGPKGTTPEFNRHDMSIRRVDSGSTTLAIPKPYLSTKRRLTDKPSSRSHLAFVPSTAV